jgi:hypothetical protein
MVIVRRAVAAAAEATVDAMTRGAREVTRRRTPRESVERRFEEGSGSASENKTNARRALYKHRKENASSGGFCGLPGCGFSSSGGVSTRSPRVRAPLTLVARARRVGTEDEHER